MSEAYVEFKSEQDITKVLQKLKTPQVKTRRVYITRSSPEQLFRVVFPHWRGTFIDGVPSIVDEQNYQQTIAFHLSSTATTTTPPPPFVEGYEYDSLLAVCRNFKVKKILFDIQLSRYINKYIHLYAYQFCSFILQI